MMKKMYIEPQTETLEVVATATILTDSPAGGDGLDPINGLPHPGAPSRVETPKL